MVTHAEELVPERLGVDGESRRAICRTGREREVIEVFRHRHGDRESTEYAASNELRRARAVTTHAPHGSGTSAAVPHDPEVRSTT